MVFKWSAAWYEQDQTIIVGDKAWFCLPSDEKNHSFITDFYQRNSFIRKKLEIKKITHPVLGNVRGIVTIGLDYTIYLADGTMLEVNAEEQKRNHTIGDNMKPQNKVGLIKRYALFLVGLFIASMGVAFSTKAGLGTSPVASLPYSVSLVSKLFTFGGWLNLLSVIQIVTQVVILKGKVNYIEIAVQTVLASVYGYLTNLSCYLIRGIEVSSYSMQFLFMLLGCAILAFGI